MSPHDWFILVAAAAFLLIGIAISPLAWLALRQQKDQYQEATDRRMQRLEARIDQLSESQAVGARPRAGAGRSEDGEDPRGKRLTTPRPQAVGTRPRLEAARFEGRSDLRASNLSSHDAMPRTLIAIPKLSPTLPDSDTNLDTLADRYGTIWHLADSGSSPDAIARATGQPVGQVELILACADSFLPLVTRALRAVRTHNCRPS